MSANGHRGGRQAFLAKGLVALGLVALADQLFWAHDKGWSVGLFGLVWTLAVVALDPLARRSARAWVALALAAKVALVQVDRPTLLGWSLLWVCLTAAVLLPRVKSVGDTWAWSQRLLFNGLTAIVRPLLDAMRLRRALSRKGSQGRRWLTLLGLPLIGGGVFLALFAAANPLIARAISDLRAPDAGPGLPIRLGMALLTLVAVWGVLRPRVLRAPIALPVGRPEQALPGVSVGSVTLSLLLFNALFALQNGLDIAFLWSGARLPEDFTLAEYAHRGAYPLLATALLAGLFVLVALRPGSESARRPLVRWLVALWVAQNVFLVASSIQRTLLYMESYSLTRMRIWALAWMVLVAVGLALILWRLLRGRSGAWLINANALAAGLVLAAATVIDPGAIAADWNTRHAREVGGRGVELDVCYLARLGPPSLVPLTRLERGLPPGVFRNRVDASRRAALADAQARQADWRGWTWRNSRRLTAADKISSSSDFPHDGAHDDACYDSSAD